METTGLTAASASPADVDQYCQVDKSNFELCRKKVSDLISHLVEEGTRFEDRYFWHRTRDSYVLFLAEFFLRRSNRTTVERNLPSFLRLFPTAYTLSHADPDEVLIAAKWAGLRNRTAHLPEIMSRFTERDEWTASELKGLPYIGDYAAEGIALYVFGEPTFPVDNNVRRVIGRYLGVSAGEEFDQAIRAVRREAIRTGGSARLRLVHMGALALGWDPCKSKPKCLRCPLSNDCIGHVLDFDFSL